MCVFLPPLYNTKLMQVIGVFLWLFPAYLWDRSPFQTSSGRHHQTKNAILERYSKHIDEKSCIASHFLSSCAATHEAAAAALGHTNDGSSIWDWSLLIRERNKRRNEEEKEKSVRRSRKAEKKVRNETIRLKKKSIRVGCTDGLAEEKRRRKYECSA